MINSNAEKDSRGPSGPSGALLNKRNNSNGFVFDGADTYIYEDHDFVFDGPKTFDCGQCFRWEPVSDCSFKGAVDGKILIAKGSNGRLEIRCLSGDHDGSFSTYLDNYFDIATDYASLTSMLSEKDEVMKAAAECAFGIRLLRQDLFETVISFIISANNNIPRIKKCIANLCRIYGRPLTGDLYSFPEPETLASADPSDVTKLCRVGYRGPYITATAKLFAEGNMGFEKLINESSSEARKEILALPGVGPKVNSCIMLFSGLDRSSFPVDVWVERMMKELYGIEAGDRSYLEKYGKEYFGENAGLAQQYLFYYIRKISRPD